MIPHKWLVEAMKLAKVPEKLISAVNCMLSKWSTKLFHRTDKETLETDKIGPPGNRNEEISHLFFVDDLKTFAQDEQHAKLQLDLITTFTNDIGMQFGSDKCAYCNIERGTQKSLGSKFEINVLELMNYNMENFISILGKTRL